MRRLIGFALLAAVAGAGCKKTAKKADPEPTPAPAASAGGGNTNFVPGGGAVQNVRQAGRRTVALNDVHQLGVFMEQMYTENGKMPAKADVVAYIERDAPRIKKAIDDGDIVLTPAAAHDGLWAHEVEADTKGGIVLVAGRAARASADDVKKLLGK